MKNIYKVSTVIGSIAAILSPMAIVVSCGSDNSRNLNTVTKKSVKGVHLHSNP